MTYPNGQIPDSALVGISGGGALLSGAAAAWESLRGQVAARHGWSPTPTDSLSAYRPYATQERIFRDRYTTAHLVGRPVKIWGGVRWYLRPGKVTAAVPGTSNHGLGIAVDITGLGGFTGTRYRQLAEVAAGLGWSNVEGRAIGEAWHWVYTGQAVLSSNSGAATGHVPASPNVTTPTPIEEDDDMPLNDDDKAWIRAAIEQGVNKAGMDIVNGSGFKIRFLELLDMGLRTAFSPGVEVSNRVKALLNEAKDTIVAKLGGK